MAHIDFWLCCINHFSSKSLIDTIEEKFVQVATKQQNRKTEQHAQQTKVADALQELLTIVPAADS